MRAVALALRGKLRHAGVSEDFIGRFGEDLLQQALSEYSLALRRGKSIYNPGGWVVNTAYRRAIDQLRKEGREGPLAPVEDSLAHAELSSEEEAVQRVQLGEVHAVVQGLPLDQRRALGLYFFEGMTTRAGARALGWSEPTFRRRRDAGLRAIRERLGVDDVEGALALDLGLVAYISLSGGSGDRLAALIADLRAIGSGVVGRLGEMARQLAGISDAGGGVLGGPAAKAGVCGAAAAVCLAGGVVGPGVGGLDLISGGQHHARSKGPVGVRKNRVAGAQGAAEQLRAASEPPARDTPSGAGGRGDPVAKRRSGAATPSSSTSQARQEFGLEGSSGTAAPSSSSSGATASSTSTGSSTATAPASSGGGSSGSGTEFGFEH